LRILLLGPESSPLVPFLRAGGDEVVVRTEALDVGAVEALAPDAVVSYGYRHVLPADVVARLPKGRSVNLHISLLPWNRGADPNFWSALDGTPAGVTIHHLSAGLDSGDVAAQRAVEIGDEETLRSSYDRLQQEIQTLFREIWPRLREGRAPRQPQPPGGSYHRVADRAPLEHLLNRGWDTRVGDLRAAGRRLRDQG
jgi:methionyl-tRNA formyltransferase